MHMYLLQRKKCASLLLVNARRFNALEFYDYQSHYQELIMLIVFTYTDYTALSDQNL